MQLCSLVFGGYQHHVHASKTKLSINDSCLFFFNQQSVLFLSESRVKHVPYIFAITRNRHPWKHIARWMARFWRYIISSKVPNWYSWKLQEKSVEPQRPIYHYEGATWMSISNCLLRGACLFICVWSYSTVHRTPRVRVAIVEKGSPRFTGGM